MSFEGRSVIVTGASSGIGASIAIKFAEEGANVSIIGRNEEKLKNITEKFNKFTIKPLVIKADVTNEEDAKRIISETVEKFGKIDVLVNNAGFVKYGSLLDGKVMEAYDDLMNTNLRAVVNLTYLAVPHLIKVKGNIVNVSSALATKSPPLPTYLPYTVSKAGLNHFSRGAALELASHGVRVNVVSPGPVNTDFLENSGIKGKWEDTPIELPLGRFGVPEDISELVLYLASDKAKSVTGSVFVSDLGYSLKY